MPGVVEASCWSLRGLLVVSTLNNGELPRGGQGLSWHVSASTVGARRCNDRQLARVRRDFRMEAAEEDNHQPGIARNLFLSVDPAFRVTCECKETEVQILEPDGFRWSKAENGPLPGDLLVMDSGIGVEHLNKASLDQYLQRPLNFSSMWPDLQPLNQHPEKKR